MDASSNQPGPEKKGYTEEEFLSALNARLAKSGIIVRVQEKAPAPAKEAKEYEVKLIPPVKPPSQSKPDDIE